MRNHPYIFGYENGIPPDLEMHIWAKNAVDRLFAGIMSEEEMRQRENIRLFREAICQVAEEITDRYFPVL